MPKDVESSCNARMLLEVLVPGRSRRKVKAAIVIIFFSPTGHGSRDWPYLCCFLQAARDQGDDFSDH
jgi:hypothetical protein